jgi:hypothetical protein
MKGNWNLIKELLLRIECLELGQHFAKRALAQHSLHAVENHLRLMHHAGLIECSLEQTKAGEPEFVAHNLTQAGRDLLSTILDSDFRKHSLLSNAGDCARNTFRQTA